MFFYWLHCVLFTKEYVCTSGVIFIINCWPEIAHQVVFQQSFTYTVLTKLYIQKKLTILADTFEKGKRCYTNFKIMAFKSIVYKKNQDDIPYLN